MKIFNTYTRINQSHPSTYNESRDYYITFESFNTSYPRQITILGVYTARKFSAMTTFLHASVPLGNYAPITGVDEFVQKLW